MKTPNFVSIAALMEDIGRGIGAANQELVTRAQTDLGTLAVKAADVTVNFELTSTATSRNDQLSLDAPLAGAKTLSYGTESFEEKHINRCSITLSIVSVAHRPDPDEESGDEKAGGQDNRPIEVALPGAGGDEEKRLLAALGQIREAAERLPGELGRPVLRALKEIEDLVHGGQFDAARSALAELAAKYNVNLNP